MSTSFSIAREQAPDGRFHRQESRFRRWVTADASSGFPAVAGRYHLYVSYACPWASRAVIVRKLKGLEDVVSLSAVDPIRDERGWAFTGGEYTDPLNGFALLAEAYEATEPGFDERVTVPVLWDRETRTIVSNESADVIRMLDRAFPSDAPPLCPPEREQEIDALNAWTYAGLNNAVYEAGFARTQAAYEEAYERVFATLDVLERTLADRRFLLGSRPLETDWRVFTTLVRFDAVYVGHFKCNRNRLVDLPNLWGYARDLYQWPGIAEDVRLGEIKRHYYATHPMINPSGIVPRGPRLDFTTPHGREGL
jgi:putative glutathione S-transferase